MNAPTYSFVDDGRGGFTTKERSPSFFTDKNTTPALFNEASIALVIMAVVGLMATFVNCIRGAISVCRPTYAPVASSDNDMASNPTPEDAFAVDIPPIDRVIADSPVQGATMERFLSNMARERLIRFSPQQLASFTRDFSTVLGSGGYGVVFKGEFPNGSLVAVKLLNNHYPDKRIAQQFMAEVSTIGRTYHMNLVRLYGFCFDSTMIALVYEYMENGSLDKFLTSDNQAIEWRKLHEIAVGTAKGIAYLHEECQEKIIHYDIKAANVLLDANLNPKVADFGLAKLCSRESSRVFMTGFRGTPGYAAPELWKRYPVTHKCDIYSFGMLLFEIVGRRSNVSANISGSQEWLPRWTWIMFEKNKLAEMLSLSGVAEEDRDMAERASIVALWCVQYLPEARPIMSNVVRMLEGNMEINPPPNRFEHLESCGPNGLAIESDDNSDISASMTRTSGPSYSQPMQVTLEIEAAS